MKKGEDAIAYTRKQFRDSIEIQIYIYEQYDYKYYDHCLINTSVFHAKAQTKIK